MFQDYAGALGHRLRYIRSQRGLTLKQVESASAGTLSDVVIGCYERGDRTVPVSSLAALAGIYDVPVWELLPDAGATRHAKPSNTVVVDMLRLSRVPFVDAGPLARYLAAIRSQRRDDTDEPLAIRAEDLRSLALVYGMSPHRLITQFADWGVVNGHPPVDQGGPE